MAEERFWSACADCVSEICHDRRFCMGYHANVKTVHGSVLSGHPGPAPSRPIRRPTPRHGEPYAAATRTDPGTAAPAALWALAVAAWLATLAIGFILGVIWA